MCVAQVGDPCLAESPTDNPDYQSRNMPFRLRSLHACIHSSPRGNNLFRGLEQPYDARGSLIIAATSDRSCSHGQRWSARVPPPPVSGDGSQNDGYFVLAENSGILSCDETFFS